MFRTKRILLVAACVVLTLAVVAGAAGGERVVFTVPDTSFVEYTSLRHTRVESGKKVENLLTLDGFDKKLENARTEVWFNEESASIRIVDKASGYIWGGLDNPETDELNNKWKAFADSLCSIEYYNEKMNEARISLSDSAVDAEYTWENDKLLCEFTIRKIDMSLAFTMTLCENNLLFEVVKGSFKEKGDCLLKSLYFMPFLGSTYEDKIDGYMFIPDGCGALVRYSKSSTYLTGFDQRVYGLDAGIDQLGEASNLNASRSNDFMVEILPVGLPVYGIVHGAKQNALFSVIESGEEYSAITASVAGIITNYNWVTTRFDYRRMHIHAVYGSGNGVYQPQTEANDFNPALRVYFMTGDEADYSGMANKYRSILIGQGTLDGKTEKTEQIPLRLEVLASEVEDGFLWNTTKTLTTTDEAKDFADTLGRMDINTLLMVLRGWQSGGQSGAKYGTTRVEGSIGGKKGISELNKSISENNGKLYLYANAVTANEDQVSLSRDAMITAARSFGQKVSANKTQMYGSNYFAKVSRITKLLESLKEKQDIESFALAGVGNTLYSDYTEKKEYSRTESKEAIIKSVSQFENTALYNPNLYLWEYADAYFDIPSSNSQYLFETDTIPFLQMVLKGSIDYYSTFCNQGFYSQTSILKMIEYGIYPSFIVMAEDNDELSGTPLVDYFSLNFNDWKDTINTVYHNVNGALSAVCGQSIVEHAVLIEGVVRVTYSGGDAIYVNYNSNDVEADGITVKAMSYAVKSK